MAEATSDGLICIVHTSESYPLRAGFQLLATCLADFQKEFDGRWQTAQGGKKQPLKWAQLGKLLKQYQDLASVDKITKAQQLIDETKVVMLDNIDAVMRRGENLEDLVAKTDDLSTMSKGFHKAAKKTNKRCSPSNCSVQ